MSDIIMPAFNDCPNEAAVIGRLIAGYGELEFEMAQCLARTVCDSLRRALKILFEKRNTEIQRIEIAENYIQPHYAQIGLATESEEALRAIDWCRDRRNMFSHCQWVADEQKTLFYIPLYEIARSRLPTEQFNTKPVELSLLNEMESYFRYTARCFSYLYSEHDRLAGKIQKHDQSVPPKIPQPRPHSPLKKGQRPPVIRVARHPV